MPSAARRNSLMGSPRGWNSGSIFRMRFVSPDAAKREFFFGVNFEESYAPPPFSQTRWNMEIRPIIGWRKNNWEFIFNPIVDIGFGEDGDATFAPAARLARSFGENFSLGIEYYADLGPLQGFEIGIVLDPQREV